MQGLGTVGLRPLVDAVHLVPRLDREREVMQAGPVELELLLRDRPRRPSEPAPACGKRR